MAIEALKGLSTGTDRAFQDMG